ncbi:MAG: hypothetical protein HY235_04185 [Acidobacteria bacterium]|nr:hypothetical protein [Acidobacteriota bacterium]
MERTAATVHSSLLQYVYLQILDLLTTIAFLLHGIREGNPLVRLVLEIAPNPVGGLVMLKLAALVLGVYCWRTRRLPLLNKVNFFFAALIAWNLVALIVGVVFPHRLA